jgi:hypothetical protein
LNFEATTATTATYNINTSNKTLNFAATTTASPTTKNCTYIALTKNFEFRSYNIVILVVTYIVPVAVISVCSVHMGHVLWCQFYASPFWAE